MEGIVLVEVRLERGNGGGYGSGGCIGSKWRWKV